MNVNFWKVSAKTLPVLGALLVCAPALVAVAQDADVADIAPAPFLPLWTSAKGSGHFSVVTPKNEIKVGQSDHAYPFGSRIEVANDGSKVQIFVTDNVHIRLGSGTVAVLENDPDKAGAKRLQLLEGTVETSFPRDEEHVFPFSIVTAAAVYDDIKNRVFVSATSSGNEVRSSARVPMGRCLVHAPQLEPSKLGVGSEFLITTQKDGKFTVIDGRAGDFNLLLAHGSAAPYEAALHQGSRVKIWRDWAPLTHRLAASVLVAAPDGSIVDSYAFNDGEEPIKSGNAGAAGAQTAEPEIDASVVDTLPESDELSGFESSDTSLDSSFDFGSSDDFF